VIYYNNTFIRNNPRPQNSDLDIGLFLISGCGLVNERGNNTGKFTGLYVSSKFESICLGIIRDIGPCDIVDLIANSEIARNAIL
jgi:hypothetical protein